MTERSLIETITLRLKVFFYTIVYFTLFVPIIVILIPVFLLRLIASQAKKVLRPDLDKLVDSRSSVLSCEDYLENPRWNLVVWLTQEGVLDIEKFRKDFYEEHVTAKLPNGMFKYPEYQQYYETWWGFQFWKWDTKFDIKNHIRQYDGKHQTNVVDDKRLLQIIKELTWKPWSQKRSPWEFLQISNYQMTNDTSPQIEKSILIFRIHHGLGDGYFVLKLLMDDISGIPLTSALGKPSNINRSCFMNTILKCFIWIVGPYQAMKMITEAYDVNDWRIPEEKMVKPMNAALTDQIKLNYIKDVKNAHGVSFTAVINAAIAGGIRSMMIEKGVTVPHHVTTAVAVPMPGHPPKPRNHFIFSFVALPTGISDNLKRLQISEKNILALKKSTAPLLNFMNVPLFGSIYPWMMNIALKNRHSTCLLSNFPGTPVIPNFKGVKVIDMMFGAGLGPGNVGLGFTLISHTDHIRLLSVADSNILETDEEVEELNRRIMNEIKMLKDLAPLQTTM